MDGFGLFADQAIPRGAKVIEYAGKRIRNDKAVSLGPSREKYCATVNRKWAN